MQFQSFWNSLESTVQTNSDLKINDNFSYLVSLQEGTVSLAIAGVPITEENYDAAVDIINSDSVNLFNSSQCTWTNSI